MSIACHRRCWIIFIVQISQSWNQQHTSIQFWKTASRSQCPVEKTIAVVHFPSVLGPRSADRVSPSTINSLGRLCHGSRALCWFLSRTQRRKIRSLPVNSLLIPQCDQLLIGCTFVTTLCIYVSLTLISEWWWIAWIIIPLSQLLGSRSERTCPWSFSPGDRASEIKSCCSFLSIHPVRTAWAV